MEFSFEFQEFQPKIEKLLFGKLKLKNPNANTLLSALSLNYNYLLQYDH